jgi:mannobiose 2-epimerase
MKIENPSTPSVIDPNILIKEMEFFLDQEFDLWYPLSLDTIYGGFFSDINYKWELEGRQNKMIVTQARHIWSSANGALFFNNKKYLIDIASHGFEFIKTKMWDMTL